MNIYFSGNVITRTDYFISAACCRGMAWMTVEQGTWHILLPRHPKSTCVVQASPQVAEDEPNEWQWCLDIDGEEFPLPVASIHGERPRPPDHGQALDRRCRLYTAHTISAGIAAFGGAHGLQTGLVSHPHRLWLVHGIRVDYRPRKGEASSC